LLKEHQPLITLIIPTYRRPRLLKRAIQSVLTQTYPEYKVCVYDNASGDETASVVKDFERKDIRIEYHCHSTNIGMRANFQYGLKQVDTPFFSFLCDDDIILPGFFEKALEGFKEYPEAKLSTGLAIYTDMKKITNVIPRGIEGYLEPPGSLLQMIKPAKVQWPVLPATLFRREAIDSIGYFDSETGILGFDLDYMFRIMAHHPVFVSSTPFAIRVVHPEAASFARDYQDLWPSWLILIENLSADKQIPMHIRTQIENVMTKALALNLLLIGRENIRTKNLESASKSAELLCNYFKLEKESKTLYDQIKLRKKHDSIYKILNLGQSISYLWRWRTVFNFIKLQEQYGSYLQYLTT
jgi:glycosyltransferase involved in cell wall biosynthesis